MIIFCNTFWISKIFFHFRSKKQAFEVWKLLRSLFSLNILELGTVNLIPSTFHSTIYLVRIGITFFNFFCFSKSFYLVLLLTNYCLGSSSCPTTQLLSYLGIGFCFSNSSKCSGFSFSWSHIISFLFLYYNVLF